MENGKKKTGRPGKQFIGLTFGRLNVIGPHSGLKIKCVCSCGNEVWIKKGNLTSGCTNSCGCIKRELMCKRNETITFIHGHSRGNNGRPTPTYNSYRSMLARCYDPKHDGYANYGERGIKVCERWRMSFENFLSDMGERPFGMTLDRKNVNGNYTPNNCKWSTDAEQRINTRAKLAKQTK